MGERDGKDALFAEFAAVGKVLGHPKRLELIDLLSQGPRSVDHDLCHRHRVQRHLAKPILRRPAVRRLVGRMLRQ